MAATFNLFSIIYPLVILVASFLAGWEGFKTAARFFCVIPTMVHGVNSLSSFESKLENIALGYQC
jgi:hypothetical protein